MNPQTCMVAMIMVLFVRTKHVTEANLTFIFR